MLKLEKSFDTLIGIVMSIILFLFGKIDTPIIVFFLFLGIDYLTGIIKAYMKKELSSNVGLKGFLKKVCIIIVVSFCCLLDKVTGTDGILRNFIIYYYIANEGLSILENVSLMGVKLPEKLRLALIQLEGDDK